MILVCLHGFLGDKSDFDFLSERYQILSLSLDDLVELDIHQIHSYIESKLENRVKGEEVVLCGYSFGSRMALQLINLKPDFYNKAILFAGHAGLRSDQISERLPFEQKQIELLEKQSMEEFINGWNEFNLFAHDEDIAFKGQSSLKAIIYFKNWGLSKQPYLKESLIEIKNKIFFHYGDLDKKYCDYAKEELKEFNLFFFPGVGHRILQHPEDILKRMSEIL